MDRQKCIDIIKTLYPPDSGYAQTAEIGQKIMLEAIASQWKELPLEVLNTMAQLCMEKGD